MRTFVVMKKSTLGMGETEDPIGVVQGETSEEAVEKFDSEAILIPWPRNDVWDIEGVKDPEFPHSTTFQLYEVPLFPLL